MAAGAQGLAIRQTALGNAAVCATQTKKVQAATVATLQAVVPDAEIEDDRKTMEDSEARVAAGMAAADERDFYHTLDECAAISWT